jgi:glycosyltransferase involved in cell wall biosynthesis
VNAEKAILLLGRRDQPTDGVADYCDKLREAGLPRGLSFESAQIPWAENGWGPALKELRRTAAGWRDCWVFLQFTTLAWSRRGFPLRAPRVLDVLRQCGARPAVVFHDFSPLAGTGIVGHAREYCHLRVLRQLYARSDLAVFTVPVDKIMWLPPRHDKAAFIPVGSNFPELDCKIKKNDALLPSVITVAVFGFTGGARGNEEVEDIAYALKGVQSKGVLLRLMAIGRGSTEFEGALRKALNGSGIELSALGLMPAENFVQALATAQVLLCVRGHVSTRRGNVIAGIVCGLPIVGYRGAETGFPITEAGVVLVEPRDREGLAQGLAEVLTDEKSYRDLRQRSIVAAQKYFSWDAIASQFVSAVYSETQWRSSN